MANSLGTQTKPMEWEESVKWLVLFSKVTTENLISGRPGDLPNLLFDLRRYIQADPDDDKVEQELASAQAKPAVLNPVIRKVGELLRCVAERKTFTYAYKGGTLELDVRNLDSDRALAYHDASLSDAVIQVAVEDLSEVSAKRVKRCANTDCEEIFFAARKSQIYCGNRCANLIASRTYQAQEGNKAKRRAHSRNRYRAAATKK